MPRDGLRQRPARQTTRTLRYRAGSGSDEAGGATDSDPDFQNESPTLRSSSSRDRLQPSTTQRGRRRRRPQGDGDDDGGNGSDGGADTAAAAAGRASTAPRAREEAQKRRRLQRTEKDSGGDGGKLGAEEHEDDFADNGMHADDDGLDTRRGGSGGGDDEFEGRVSSLFFHTSVDQLFPADGCHAAVELKRDHALRPLVVLANGSIILEAFSPIAEQAMDFLVAVAEPVSRPSMVHEYRLTEYSLYAAVSVGLDPQSILDVLGRLSKTVVPGEVVRFVRSHTESVGRVKMVLKDGRFFVESRFPDCLRTVLRDDTVRAARIVPEVAAAPLADPDGFFTEQAEADVAPLFGPARGRQAESAASSGAKDPSVGMTAQLPPSQPSAVLPVMSQPVQGSTTASSTDGAGAASGVDTSDLDLFDMFDSVDLEAYVSGSGELAGAEPSSLGEDGDVPSADPGGDLAAAGLATAPSVDKDDDEDEGQPDIEAMMAPAASAPGTLVSSFEVREESMEEVRRRCSEMGLPLIEEYDFRRDRTLPRLDVDLKSSTRLRPYQEKSLNKMFGNGRARSGIIVLPCGAGKTLVGVTSACTIKKSCLVLCTSGW
ncbi:hypothetical protein HK405_011179, partial [Cladochytrium tenue]